MKEAGLRDDKYLRARPANAVAMRRLSYEWGRSEREEKAGYERTECDNTADAARAEPDVREITLGRPKVADAGREIAADVAACEAKGFTPERGGR